MEKWIQKVEILNYCMTMTSFLSLIQTTRLSFFHRLAYAWRALPLHTSLLYAHGMLYKCVV